MDKSGAILNQSYLIKHNYVYVKFKYIFFNGWFSNLNVFLVALKPLNIHWVLTQKSTEDFKSVAAKQWCMKRFSFSSLKFQHDKIKSYPETCFPQGKRCKCQGLQLNGAPKLIILWSKKIYYFDEFLKRAVTFCNSPMNLAIIF